MAKEAIIETGLVPYNLDNAVIEALETKYLDIVIPPGDVAAYDMVKDGIKECNGHINDVTKWHKDKKEWILTAGRHYDGEKNRVLNKIEPIKTYLKEVKQEEDDRLKRIEEERLEAIWEKHVRPIEDAGAMLGDLEAVELGDRLTFLDSIIFRDEDFQELKEKASSIFVEVRRAVREALEWRLAQDEKEALQKAEDERLAKQKAEQDAEAARLKVIQDEINRKEAEQKAKEDALKAEEQRMEAEKQAEVARKEREAREAQIREEERQKAEKKAQEAVLQQQREKEDRERRELEIKVREEALKPEKEKCMAYISSLLEIPMPEVKDEALKALLVRLDKGIKNIYNEIEKSK
jgi:hypothetical protein